MPDRPLAVESQSTLGLRVVGEGEKAAAVVVAVLSGVEPVDVHLIGDGVDLTARDPRASGDLVDQSLVPHVRKERPVRLGEVEIGEVLGGRDRPHAVQLLGGGRHLVGSEFDLPESNSLETADEGVRPIPSEVEAIERFSDSVSRGDRLEGADLSTECIDLTGSRENRELVEPGSERVVDDVFADLDRTLICGDLHLEVLADRQECPVAAPGLQLGSHPELERSHVDNRAARSRRNAEGRIWSGRELEVSSLDRNPDERRRADAHAAHACRSRGWRGFTGFIRHAALPG